jgi:hypothetical protein
MSEVRSRRRLAFALLLISACGPRAASAARAVPAADHAARAAHEAVQFTCEPDTPPPMQPLRRLSSEQIRHTIEDLLTASLPRAGALAALNRLSPVFALLPQELVSKAAPFSSMDQAVSQRHVEVQLELAQQVSNLLTQDAEHLSALLACGSGQAASACIDQFVRRFGRLAFRHTLSEEEFAFLRSFYAGDAISPTETRNLLTAILSAPQFLYLVDRLGPPLPGKPGVYRLDPAALASQLAYHYWRTMPDDALLRSAERGELDTDEGIAAVVDRMLADPRAERSLRTFVYEWFDLGALRPLDTLVGDPVFDAFAGDALPSPDLRQAMIDDVLDSFVYHTKHAGTYADWLASPYSFARAPELAAIYGVPPWEGADAPPRFPAGTRAGMLTRAALLASGSANTRPILKGVFIRKRLLCDEVPPPPGNANNFPPQLSPDLTTREVVEKLAEQPDSSCASCHTYRIDPLGFATENYDALGRLRSEQRLFSAGGAEVRRKPVNTRAVPRVSLHDDTPVEGAPELLGLILASGKGEACFARQYVRFIFGRAEREAVDGCLLEDMRRALRGPQGLREAMRAPALQPAFRTRSLVEARGSAREQSVDGATAR